MVDPRYNRICSVLQKRCVHKVTWSDFLLELFGVFLSWSEVWGLYCLLLINLVSKKIHPIINKLQDKLKAAVMIKALKCMGLSG